MNKEKLIKNGKFYNTETSTLIAVSSWFTHYDTQRRVIYRTAKGTFFKVKEIALVLHHPHANTGSMNIPHVQFTDGSEGGIGSVTASKYSLNPKDEGFRDDVKIAEVHIMDELTEEELMKEYEHTAKGNAYSVHNGTSYKYKFLKNYEELFSIEEA
jgi:hypothetical protein